MTKNNIAAKPGDLFTIVLPDGRYGAVRILNQEGKSHLVAVTPYLDTRLPSINDSKLLMILNQNRFRYKNESAISWYDGWIPKDIQYIGNIPISEHEKMLECSRYSGKWSGSCVIPVFYEWRWIHDRENFENEILNKSGMFQESIQKRKNVPKELMADDDFWAYISILDLSRVNEGEAVSTLVTKLAKTNVRSINEFEETLAFKLYLLDTKEHAKQIGEFAYNKQEDYVSADDFLYARCAAIAKGKTFYESALKSPTKMPKDESFEMLLSIAQDAYTKRTGKAFEYETGCSYESFANKDGWR